MPLLNLPADLLLTLLEHLASTNLHSLHALSTTCTSLYNLYHPLAPHLHLLFFHAFIDPAHRQLAILLSAFPRVTIAGRTATARCLCQGKTTSDQPHCRFFTSLDAESCGWIPTFNVLTDALDLDLVKAVLRTHARVRYLHVALYAVLDGRHDFERVRYETEFRAWHRAWDFEPGIAWLYGKLLENCLLFGELDRLFEVRGRWEQLYRYEIEYETSPSPPSKGQEGFDSDSDSDSNPFTPTSGHDLMAHPRGLYRKLHETLNHLVGWTAYGEPAAGHVDPGQHLCFNGSLELFYGLCTVREEKERRERVWEICRLGEEGHWEVSWPEEWEGVEGVLESDGEETAGET